MNKRQRKTATIVIIVAFAAIIITSLLPFAAIILK